MSRFTMVPKELLRATDDLLRQIAYDPGVVLTVDSEACLFFAGSPELAREAMDGKGLACLRVLGTGVFHVDLDGIDASVEHAMGYVRMALATFQCRVFADESGEELTHQARQNPAILLAL